MSTGIFQIEIKGKPETLKFNIFSTEELKNYLFPGKHLVTQSELNEIIVEKWKENGSLLMKNLVYAGLCGHYYIIQDTCPYSKAEIGEYIAEISQTNPKELQEIFNVFFKAGGSEIIEDEELEEPVKKKTEKSS